ncbi:MAG TPA: hypothetical protein VGG19_06500 [Tepidisphaeraceae bacterium]|jgi:hypothetical protein
MSIRARIEDAMVLFAIGRLEAALLCTLTAVAASSRRRRPIGTPSVLRPGRAMGDGEAFEAFLKEEMVRICNVVNFFVQYRGSMHRLEHIFYKWMRCDLAHEAQLPIDIAFQEDPEPNSFRLEVRSDGVLVLSQGWLDGLANAVIQAPENSDQFGSPAMAPASIYLSKIDVTLRKVPEMGSTSQ